MSRSTANASWLCMAAAAGQVLACSDASQQPVQVPLSVAGVEVAEPIEAESGVSIRLQRARLAFGPLFLCAGTSAGELCEAARLQWLQSTVVNLLDPEPQMAGELEGLSGTVQSWMYDLGISSQLTRSEPYILEAAEQLGGFSVVVEGTAQRAGAELPFVLELPVQQSGATEQGVPVVRSSAAEGEAHEVLVGEPGLLIRFDVLPWIASVNLGSYFDSEPCALDLSCTEPVRVEPDSEAFRALRNAVVSGQRPNFQWGVSPSSQE